MTDKNLTFRRHEFGDVHEMQKQHLANQDVISDYDVDQSVIDIMNSILAFNTQNNSITANALFAESKIETATQRKNVVIDAKSFGYTPYSIISSKMMANITASASDVSGMPETVTIEKGTVFNGDHENGSVPFVAIRPYVASRDGNQYKFEDVELFQGSYGSIDIIIDRNRRSQIYEIPIDNIDTNYLEVYVQKAIDSEDFTEFSHSRSSINADGESKIYFLYETVNGRFALQFGDGVLGKAVEDKSIVRVVYLKTVGKEANGVRNVTFGSSPSVTSPLNKMSVTCRVTSKSAGGLDPESTNSIKRNAPKFYVSQNRGVIQSDYADIIRTRLPYINSISVWSGKEGKGYFDQFGRIYISANTDKSQFLTDKQKREIYDLVIDEIGVGGIIPIIVDVDNIYVDLDVKVYVDDFVFLKSSRITELVLGFSEKFNNDNLEKFGGVFEHSIYTEGVNNLDDTITSNVTSVKLQKRVFPDTRIRTAFEFSFMNKIKDVSSNSFTYDTKSVFIKSKIDGTLSIFEVIEGEDVLVRPNVGTVSFETGEVAIADLVVSRVNQLTKDIRFYATPLIPNVYSNRNNVVTINDVKVTVERK